MTDADERLARAIDALKEPVRMAPDLPDRVMAAIAREAAPPHRSPARRLAAWAGRRWTLSPLSGLGLAAGIAALSLLAGRWWAGSAERSVPAGLAAVAAEPGERRELTQFVLVAPRAAEVAVVGDFNDWSLSATPLERAEGDGVWWVTVPLPPGRYRYAFVVNGATWITDPDAPAVDDEFGQTSSVLTVGGP